MRTPILTLDSIRERFGDAVANIVDGCSEDKALRWRARKTERIEALRTASPEVCTVTCADKLHNLRTIISEYDDIGDSVWDRFHGGVEDQAWYYRSILSAIAARDATLQRNGVHAKVTTHANGATQHPSDDQKTPTPLDPVNPQLFRQFQQAVAHLFEGEHE